MLKFIQRWWDDYAYRKFEHRYEGVMRPLYVAKKDLWVVDTPFKQEPRQENLSAPVDSGPEVGNIDWVLSEFSTSGLYFPFWDTRSREKHYHEHAHTFSEVLTFLARDPAGFSVDDFKTSYSEQELEFIAAVKRRYAELDQEDALKLKK